MNYSNPEFTRHFEKTVSATIKKYSLIKKSDRLVVAVSGGKDSVACLYNLKGYAPIALAIDEGIGGYRDKTLRDLRRFCSEHGIPLKVVSMKKEFGFTLDKALKRTKEKPCTVCGAVRRYLINRHARKLKATKLATGHNLDDEAQSVIMNIFRNQLEVSARLGPMTGLVKDKRFIPRIKPIYFLTEKEVAAYVFLKGFGVRYVECPYARDSYRGRIQELLNEYEHSRPGTKRNIIKGFLKQLPELRKKHATDEKIGVCGACGEPARGELCKVCEIVESIRSTG